MSENYSEAKEHEVDPLFDEDGNRILTEGAPPPEPTVRKGVMGTAAGTGALLILYLANKWGLPMDIELALVIAGGIGSLVAYVQREY